MSIHRSLVIAATASVLAAGGLLMGCSPAAPAHSPIAESSAPVPEAESNAPQTAQPLLRISGTATDPEGQTLSVTMTVTGVSTVTDEDRRDFAAGWCGTPESEPELYDADARTVSISVEAVGSDGFQGWPAGRGILLEANAFEGSIWRSPFPESPCAASSEVFRPGTGSAKLLASPRARDLGALEADQSITLKSYGLYALAMDASGQPVEDFGITDCQIESSPELERLAAEVSSEFEWGRRIDYPAHCLYGRPAAESF